MKTIGIFSKLGMPGGSENRALHLANAFSEMVPTYLFAQEKFSDKLKPQLNPKVILRENTVHTKKTIYELQGVDALLVINSDSYSFCKPSFWDGTQNKHHNNNIDISQIPCMTFLFNYVVGPGQWLVDLHKINHNIKILTTCKWFIDNINRENKFTKLRELSLPVDSINSPVSLDFDVTKKPSDKIRINRHSMSFAYKHDEDNLKVVQHLCNTHDDKIQFKWMGVPSHVRDLSSSDKHDKVKYREILQKYSQMKILEAYSQPVPDLLSETDILFFYISRHRKEPWPRTIAEAMMAGCCCVTNNTYGMKEQIKHGKTGYLFNDTKHAIEILDHLIEHPDKMRQVGTNAKEYAKKYISSEYICHKTLKYMNIK